MVIPKYLLILIGIIVGVLATTFMNSFLTQKKSCNEIDNNNDGLVDCSLYYNKSNQLIRVEYDRNFDKITDYIEYFTSDQVTSSKADDNFDSHYDRWSTYTNGNIDIAMIDIDGNGKPDLFDKYLNSVLYLSVFKLNGSTNSVRLQEYKNGVLDREYIDSDGRGMLDTIRIFEPYGNKIREEHITPPITQDSFFKLRVNHSAANNVDFLTK